MGTHVHCGGLSAFSALHLLRSYNHLLGPSGADLGPPYHPLLLTPGVPPFQGSTAPNYPHLASEYSSPLRGCSSFPPLMPLVALPSNDKRARHATGGSSNSKRPRGEKKPIPEEQKDEKYFERRKRNNQAAKKSRDARKLREDQIALRAAYLEEERAIHRSQEQVLRSQVQSLSRQIQLLTSQVQALSSDKEALSKELQTARLVLKMTQQQDGAQAHT